jgi:hypothetical protein
MSEKRVMRGVGFKSHNVGGDYIMENFILIAR